MLKSTYTPPPPLPPGWTEHKAPSGLSSCDFSHPLASSNNQQATHTIITPKPSNPHIPDHRQLLRNRHHTHKLQTLSPMLLSSPPIPYHHFPLHRMRLRDTVPRCTVLPDTISHDLAFAEENRTRIVGTGVPKTGRDRNMLYLDANPGFL
jgi:hypothetical protein